MYAILLVTLVGCFAAAGPKQRTQIDELYKILLWTLRPTYACTDAQTLGGVPSFGQIDGEWTVCFDDDGAWTASEICNVFSVGSANEFSWDDAMVRLGCNGLRARQKPPFHGGDKMADDGAIMPVTTVAERALLVVAQTLPLTAATYDLAVRLNRLNRRFRDMTWRPPVYASYDDARAQTTDPEMRAYWREKSPFAPAIRHRRPRQALHELLDKIRDFRHAAGMNLCLPNGISDQIAEYTHDDEYNGDDVIFSTDGVLP